MSFFIRSTGIVGLIAVAAASAEAMIVVPDAPPPGGKVVITSCAVAFALKSSGSSSTNAGMFNTQNRSEVTVTKVYELAGFDTTSFQRIADAMCGGAPATLTAAGYEVVTAGVSDHYAWKDMQERGKTSPEERKIGDTEYRIYAPTGQKLVDMEVVGGMAAGRLFWGETTLGSLFSAQPVNILYTVDFAAIEADNRRSRVADQNTARVAASVNLTVGARVISYDASEDNVRCNPLGASRQAREQPYCALRKNEVRQQGTYSTNDSTSRRYPEAVVSVVEQSLGAGGVAMGAANALALMSGGRRRQLERFTVTVDPAKYEEAAKAGAAGILTDAMRWINEPETRPQTGRRRR